MPRKKSLTIFMLAMINVAAIASIKNWPITAEYGFSSVFYFVISILVFFLPVAFVSAELATGWPLQGGVYAWVKEALGHRLGFLAIWLQWISNVVWYPTILSFIAGTLAFAFNPALAKDPFYAFAVVLLTFWSVTYLNLRGMKTSGWISTLGVIFGTIIPGTAIILLGFAWYFSGKPINIEITRATALPPVDSISQFALLAGVLLGLAGMEMSAVHARDVEKPRKNYPRAIFLSAAIIILLSILGTLAIAMVIPKENISLIAGGMEAISYFLNAYNLGWAIPLIAIMITIGAFGGVATWAAGPSRGLLAAANDGDFPPILHRINKNNMPIAMFIFQGVIISLLAMLFLFIPDINTSFWMLVDLSSELYLIMYMIMFISAIVLRYKKPNVERIYRIPFGNLGMWFVASIGFLGSLGTFIASFYPPAEIETGDGRIFVSFLVIGIVSMVAMPFIILLFKKPSWNEITPRFHHED